MLLSYCKGNVVLPSLLSSSPFSSLFAIVPLLRRFLTFGPPIAAALAALCIPVYLLGAAEDPGKPLQEYIKASLFSGLLPSPLVFDRYRSIHARTR